MSTDPDINTPCPISSETQVFVAAPDTVGISCENVTETKRRRRTVSFPADDQLVTQYFEPANPWQDVPQTSRAQLAAEYLESCRRHRTPAIDSVLQQIRELPESAIGGSVRAPRLTLSECALRGAAPADALEAVLRRVQFRRLEIDHAVIDDEGAEAIFDMIEYYESALIVSISGERHFGIRGWQAASRMIKKSGELSELEVSESPLEGSHAPVLARALRPHTCRLRTLCLQRSVLSGEPLLCLVIALKSNNSVRELRLGDNRLSPADAAQIGSLLRLNTRLQLLDLSNNQIQDIGFGHIAEALVEQAAQSPPSHAASPASPADAPDSLTDHRCPLTGYEARGLAFLVLWNNQLTRNCAVHLGKALRSSQSLCVLNIGRNAVGAEGVRALVAGGGGALVSLGLQAARLGPDAAPALADLVCADTKLQRLDLRDNRLGASGLQCILAALKQNSVLTQIDLDEPTESSSSLSEDGEAATAARLTREIRALCGRNEPAASSPERRVHRKISLTCHTACVPLAKAGVGVGVGVGVGGGLCAEEERRGRLRSPAPSPAGSPIPSAHHSRFSVTRVTPEREAAPGYCAPPSRFKVVQVSEPPQIQVHPVPSQPRKSNRFSVTRNYDSMYNPQAPPPSPAPGDRPATPDTRPVTPEIRPVTPDIRPITPDLRPATPDLRPATPDNRPVTPDIRPVTPDMRPITPDTRPFTPDRPVVTEIRPATPDTRPVTPEIRPVAPDTRFATPEVRPVAPEVRPVTPDTRPVTPEVRPSCPNRPSEANVSSTQVALMSPYSGSNVAQVGPESPQVRPTTQHCCSKVGLNTASSGSSTQIESDTSKIGPDASRIGPETIRTGSDTTRSGPGTAKIAPDSRSGREITHSGSDTRSGPRITQTELDTRCGPDAILRPDTMRPEPTGPTQNTGSSTTVASVTPTPVPDEPSGPQLGLHRPSPSQVNIVPQDASLSFKSEQTNVNKKISDKHSDIAKNTNGSCKSINKSDTSVKDLVVSDSLETVTHSEVVDRGAVKTETRIVKNSKGVSETEIVDVQLAMTVKCTPKNDQNIFDFRHVDEVCKDNAAMKQIEAITEDLGNLIQEFKDLSTKSNVNVRKVRSDCTQTDNVALDAFNVPGNVIKNVVLKKNKSESSLDSPDLEVSRLMNKKLGGGPFCDSSSSLEISGSSVESLNMLDSQGQVKPVIVSSIESDTELDRRKTDIVLSTGSSIESNTSEVTPVNSNLLNMSVSSNESVSPIIFGKSKKMHDSLSSLEASVSSLDSGRHEKVMVTSADSGIEYSLQHPSEIKDDNSSNEGTLTNNSSLKETVKKDLQETVTSPKRTSSLLDVPALKTKGLSDRMRKISWVAPSPSFHIPKPEPEKEMKLPSHLDKLLSLFQHPLFSRSSNEEEKKTSNTPPRKDSSLTSSFWSWGSSTEREKEDERDSSSEATDSTLSERVQVSFVDESFSKKLDSKTPSTDTDNTLSEFQTFQNSESDTQERVTYSTDDNLVQKCLVLSKSDSVNPNGNARTSDNADLSKPIEINKNYDATPAGDNNRNEEERLTEEKEVVRPRSFAAVLKSSGSENSLDKQSSPDSGQPVDKLPSKVIRGIKENISPENTLTSSMTNTKTLALELTERQVKNQPIVNVVWEVTPMKSEPKVEEVRSDLAPIATIEETCDEGDNAALDFIDDPKFDDKNTSTDSGVTSLEGVGEDKKFDKVIHSMTTELEQVDLGKDALSYLIYENAEFATKAESNPPQGSLAQELQDAEIKELLDLSPELVIDEAIEVPEVFTVKEMKGLKTSPVIPERAKIKKANSLEELSQEKECPKTKTIAFKVPEISTTTPRDIPERRFRLRTRSGSSPKSLPESLSKPCPLSKMDSILSKKKKKVSSLGKMAKDSLLALNMSEDEIAEFRRSYKLTSVESLKSLESVSEDANSQSGNSVDSRCRACLRTSQESLMSLDSITEDCRCTDDCEKPGHSNR